MTDMAIAVRILIPFLSLSLASAAEVLTPVATPVPAAFEFSSGGAAAWSLDPTHPSTAAGGVSAIYEGIVIQADHLTLLQSPVPGTPGNIPAEGDLLPGDAGPAGNRVLLDTHQATLPTIGFKGVLTPSAVNIRRLPPDPARHGIVDYQVLLPDTGAFEGQLQTKEGWAPFRGWSDRTELILEGDTLSGTLANLRVVRIVLNGHPAAGDTPRHNAEITRLKAGVSLPPLDQAVPDEAMAGHINAVQIVITLDAMGKPSASWSGGKFTGDLNFLNMRDLSSPSPAPKPVP